MDEAVRGVYRSLLWVRGPATVKDGWISLNLRHAETYVPTLTANLLFDLAHLGINNLNEQSAMEFANQYGLLWNGAIGNDPPNDASEPDVGLEDGLSLFVTPSNTDSKGSEILSEPLSAWNACATNLRVALAIYSNLQKLEATKSLQQLEAENWLRKHYAASGGRHKSASLLEIERHFYGLLAEWVNKGLEGVGEAIISGFDLLTLKSRSGVPVVFEDTTGMRSNKIGKKVMGEFQIQNAGETRKFVFSPYFHSLPALAYYQLALRLTMPQPIQLCTCGRFFVVNHKNKRFCSPRCSTNQRVKRNRAKTSHN